MTDGSTTIMSSAVSPKSMKSPSKASIEMIRQFARTCIEIKDARLNVMMAN